MNQTKLRLITAGMEFIQKNGVENLSLREIAKQCGVTHAGPYKHFKNKDDFLKGCRKDITGIRFLFDQEYRYFKS